VVAESSNEDVLKKLPGLKPESVAFVKGFQKAPGGH
jgi:hypothetical protein